MLKKLIAAVLILSAAPFAHAEKIAAQEAAAQIGPTIGAEYANFEAVNASGETVSLEAITGETGAVLVFSRSMSWCPFCQKQAIELKEAVAPLAEAGWTLNMITYDSPEKLEIFDAKNDINYSLLSDTGSNMINAFNLRNTGTPAGSVYDGIPHPAIVFLSAEGEVLAMLREEGYVDRPPVSVVLETAEELARQS